MVSFRLGRGSWPPRVQMQRFFQCRCSIYDSAAAYQDSWPRAPAQDLSAHPDK
ncbi:BQ5605_C011g06604 [Microbotryum silenes-dioicae]|uniref:BQ5605_C011g06604 protein n=1 Tax=Microbotryum silenes-dioicae TaxID=796604 RepID=A0A2X0NLT4_9BASI|nr:BQ5605_C011g06604 [Microbotryum silenes-dioicae]